MPKLILEDDGFANLGNALLHRCLANDQTDIARLSIKDTEFPRKVLCYCKLDEFLKQADPLELRMLLVQLGATEISKTLNLSFTTSFTENCNANWISHHWKRASFERM